MANEVTTTSQLVMDNGNAAPFTLGGLSVITSLGNQLYIRQEVTVGTSEAALDKGSVSTIGWAYFKNLDPTNFIDIRRGSGSGNHFGRLLPGMEWSIYVGDTFVPWAIADTGSCKLDYCLFAY